MTQTLHSSRDGMADLCKLRGNITMSAPCVQHMCPSFPLNLLLRCLHYVLFPVHWLKKRYDKKYTVHYFSCEAPFGDVYKKLRCQMMCRHFEVQAEHRYTFENGDFGHFQIWSLCTFFS